MTSQYGQHVTSPLALMCLPNLPRNSSFALRSQSACSRPPPSSSSPLTFFTSSLLHLHTFNTFSFSFSFTFTFSHSHTIHLLPISFHYPLCFNCISILCTLPTLFLLTYPTNRLIDDILAPHRFIFNEKGGESVRDLFSLLSSHPFILI